MERAVDKSLILLACTLLALLDAGTLPVTELVISLLVGIAASAAFELMALRWPSRGGASRWAMAMLALAFSLWAPATCTLPLMAYDLARSRRSLPLSLLCTLPSAIWTWRAALSPAAGAGTTIVCAFATTLSIRTTTVAQRTKQLHVLRDELSDKLLALRRKNTELLARREEEARSATLAERTRLAREVHDGVGHVLTRLLLQVEALKVVHAADDMALDELTELSQGLNEALTAMRASVHALSDSAMELDIELNHLVASCGIPKADVEYSADSTPPAPIAKALLSLVREALTNAARHAHAQHATIRVHELPGLWQVVVQNDGTMPSEAAAGDLPAAQTGGLLERLFARGMGLDAMRGRIEQLGGTLRITCSDKFTVFASIPKEC